MKTNRTGRYVAGMFRRSPAEFFASLCWFSSFTKSVNTSPKTTVATCKKETEPNKEVWVRFCVWLVGVVSLHVFVGCDCSF